MNARNTITLFLSFLLIALIPFVPVAQNTVEVGSKEYDQLKQNGQLEGFLLTTPEVTRQVPEITIKSGGGGNPNVNCGCFVPLDSTFDVVPFPFGSPPDYQNDDGSFGPVSIPFNFCFYGQQQTSFYINNNGNISFGSSYSTYSPVGFPSNQYSMIAPFWGDVDTRGTGNGAVYYKVTPTYAVIKWKDVGYFSQHTDKLNDFQLIITNGSDPIIPGGNNVAFCYGDMNWTTGDASGGSNGFGGSPATVGANKGDGSTFVQFGRFDQPGTAYDGPFGAEDGVDWLDNQSFILNACVQNSNLAPIADDNVAICDTIQLCTGDTFDFNFSFLSPEQGQTVTTDVDTSNISGFTLITNTSGPSSDIEAQFIASTSNMGINEITFTATDDGTPAQTSTFTVVINVSEIVDPQLSGNFTYCAPNSAQVTLDSAFVYADYFWSTGDAAPDSSLSLQEGDYSVTVYNDSGCARTEEFSIVELGGLTVNDNVQDVSCNGAEDGTIIFSSSVPSLLDYVWLDENGDTLEFNQNTNGTDSLSGLEPGTYIVSAYDTSGCFSTTDTVTVIEPTPLEATTSTTTASCEEDNGSATVSPSGGTAPYDFNWEPTGGNDFMANNIEGGTYTITVTDANGCEWTDSITVDNIESPTAAFTHDPEVTLSGEEMSFMDQSSANNDSIVSIIYFFGDGASSMEPNPVHTYQDTGWYNVMMIVENSAGCLDTVYDDIYVSPELKIPNIITPDGDDLNDKFVIANITALYPNSSIKIYNRWGRKVYESSNYQNDWDTENYKGGTYYYILGLNGGETKTGHVTIIK